MNTYTPVLNYPKNYPMSLSEEEQSAFDINDKDQAANFIGDAIQEIYKGKEEQPDRDGFVKTGLIIEGMLEESFGTNFSNLPSRDFVMDYVLKNFRKASNKHELMVKALKEHGLI